MDTENKKELLRGAIVKFEQTAESLIGLLCSSFDLNLEDEDPFCKLISRRTNLWKWELEGDWVYQFHGGACKF